MTTNFKKNNSKGFTLLEMLVAISMITVGLTAVTSLMTNTISGNTMTNEKLIGIQLAQEGIELVRNIRDTNWVNGNYSGWKQGINSCVSGNCSIDYFFSSSLSNSGGDSYLRLDANNSYQYISGNNTIYKRKFSVTDGGGFLQVECIVSWEGKNPGSIKLVNKLYGWQ